MVAEILAGIALVKASVDFVKSNISTINDIGEIAGQIDAAFAGRRECQKARSKDKGMSLRQQFGASSPAQAVIDAKLADEALYELKFMVIDRFDLKTWEMIEEAQRDKIRMDKAEAQAQRAAKAESQEQLQEMAVVGASLAIGILIVAGIALIMFAAEGR